MGKLDPIVSEFESDEDEAAYDAWFRAQVETALASGKPRIPHAEVMTRVAATIARNRNARSDLGE